MSKIQICNRALSTYLGVARINSLTESTPAAEQCDLHYDDTVRSLLEMDEWIFATGRKTLAEVTNDRTDEWAYKYANPSSLLLIRWVNDPEIARMQILADGSADSDREMIEGFIYSDVQYAVCEYTKLVTDPTIFPQYFADAVSAALAASIAMPLTESLTRAKNASNVAEQKFEAAMVMNERQAPAAPSRSLPDWTTDRGVS